MNAIAAAFEHGLAFTKEDIERLIATNRDFMWNREVRGGRFQRINGGPADPRWKDAPGMLWTALAPYDSTLQAIFVANHNPAGWGGMTTTPWALLQRVRVARTGGGDRRRYRAGRPVTNCMFSILGVSSLSRTVRRAGKFRMSTNTQISDREFVSNLRTAVHAYLGAVDRWEAAFQKHYRMPGCAQNSADMEVEQRDYNQRRRELEALLPRARRLCLRQELRDPFSSLMRVSLGRFAPQERTDSVIGRGERSKVSVCLLELHEACIEWVAESAPSDDRRKPRYRSLLNRVVDYFY